MIVPFETLADVESHFTIMAQSECEEPGFSELEHALQCAAELKAMAPGDEALQIAGLLHDVASGHCKSSEHGEAGAGAVLGLFGERVAALVRLHVPAKRYLVSTDAAYRAKLSEVSTHTLSLQGGTMTPEEIANFESEPFWRDALRLRHADEAAKTIGRSVPGVESWLPVLRRAALR